MDRLNERYELLREIGSGGMGVVHLARHRQLRRLVALKRLLPQALGDESARRRFHREASLFRGIHHPHVVRVLDIDVEHDPPYLTFEYIENARTLVDLIPRTDMSGPERSRLLVKIASGLAHIHEQGVIHRDLKPANVLVDQAGEPRLIDLGLARSVTDDETRLTQDGQVLGTLSYMAPEQMLGEDAGPAADLYAFGLMAIEVLLGRFVFSARAPTPHPAARRLVDDSLAIASTWPQLPAHWIRILDHILRRRPQDRWPDATKLLAELERPGGSGGSPGAGDPTLVIPPPLGAGSGSPRPRALVPRDLRRTLVAIAVIPAVLLLVWSSSRHRRTESVPVDATTVQPVPVAGMRVDAERAWAAVSRVDANYVGKQVLAGSSRPGRSISEKLRALLPPPLFDSGLLALVRQHAPEDRASWSARLRQCTQLACIEHALLRTGESLPVHFEDLLPVQYRESLEVVNSPDSPLHPGTPRSSAKSAFARLDGRVLDATRTNFPTGRLYTGHILQEGGFSRSRTLEKVLGVGESTPEPRSRRSWLIDVDLEAGPEVTSGEALVGVYTSDLGRTCLRIRLNEDLEFHYSKPLMQDGRVVRGDPGHRVHLRSVLPGVFHPGINRIQIDLTPVPGAEGIDSVFMGNLYLFFARPKTEPILDE